MVEGLGSPIPVAGGRPFVRSRPRSTAALMLVSYAAEEKPVTHATMIVKDAPDRVVCERCHVADRAHARLRGLLGRKTLPAGEGLLLRPSPSIHTWFMRFPTDAAFLDADLRVLDVSAELPP